MIVLSKLSVKLDAVFIIVFIIIFISDDTVTFGTNMDLRFIICRYAAYFTLTVFLLFNVRYNTIKISKTTFYAGVVFISLLLTILSNQYLTGGYFVQMWIVLLALLIVKYVNFDDFCTSFLTVMFYLSVISLFFFVFYNLFPSVFSIFPITTNYANVEFYNLYVCALFKTTGVIRNTSIFREPGVFMIYLIMAIVIGMFRRENNKYLLIYVIALFTTFSTAGFIVFLFVLIAKMLEMNSKRIYMYIGFGLIFFMILLWPFIGDAVFGKFGEDHAGYASTLARVSSVTVPFSIFLDNPILGSGIEKFVSLYPVHSMQQYGVEFKPDGESTNTILNTAAIFGMCYAIMILYALYHFSCFFVKKKVSRMVLFIVFILLSSNEELRFSLLFNVILLYGMSCSLKTVLKLNKN